MDEQPILVPGDVEDQPVIVDEIDIGPEPRLHISWPCPACSFDQRIPRPQRHFRLRTPFPELAQGPLRSDLHSVFPFWEHWHCHITSASLTPPFASRTRTQL